MNMRDTLARLVEITDGCRHDMHEPDGQSLAAHVVGSRLDNAFGDYIGIRPVVENFQEFVVVLERVYDGPPPTIRREQFNLATLIALARRAQFSQPPAPTSDDRSVGRTDSEIA